MFTPYNVMISTVDPIEQSRIRSGRPASRAEILDRHTRDSRIDAAQFNYDLASSTTVSRSSKGESFPMTAFDRVRRGISQFLMSAAQRIEPEAA